MQNGSASAAPIVTAHTASLKADDVTLDRRSRSGTGRVPGLRIESMLLGVYPSLARRARLLPRAISTVAAAMLTTSNNPKYSDGEMCLVQFAMYRYTTLTAAVQLTTSSCHLGR